MNIKTSTKISQARWLLLALWGIALPISVEVVAAQAGGKFTLRNRNESKARTSVVRQREAAHNDVRRDVVEEVIDSYTLHKYRLAIYSIPALKAREYSDFNKEDNISYVAAHLCQCLLGLAEDHFNEKRYKEAKAAYDKVGIIKERHNDTALAQFDGRIAILKPRLEAAYNTQEKKEVLQKLLRSYGLQLHQSAIAAMEDLNSRKYINFTPEQNDSYVSYYIYKYCLKLMLKFYECNLYPDARNIYAKAREVFKNNEGDKDFEQLRPLLKLPRKVQKALFLNLGNKRQALSEYLALQDDKANAIEKERKNSIIHNTVASYGLQLHEAEIAAMKDVKARNYNAYSAVQNEYFVSFYICKYCFILVERYYCAGMCAEAMLAYDMGLLLIEKYGKDESFNIFKKYADEAKKILDGSDYNSSTYNDEDDSKDSE